MIFIPQGIDDGIPFGSIKSGIAEPELNSEAEEAVAYAACLEAADKAQGSRR